MFSYKIKREYFKFIFLIETYNIKIYRDSKKFNSEKMRAGFPQLWDVIYEKTKVRSDSFKTIYFKGKNGILSSKNRSLFYFFIYNL